MNASLKRCPTTYLMLNHNLETEIERLKGEIRRVANSKIEEQVGKGKRGAAQAEVYRKRVEALTKQLEAMSVW